MKAGKSTLWIFFGFPVAVTLVAMTGARFSGFGQKAKVGTTKEQLREIVKALDVYDRDCQKRPTTEQSLSALVAAPVAEPRCANWKGPYLQVVPSDGWGEAFVYDSDGALYSLKSFGRDHEAGGDGFSRDIESE
jgi:general secretion pathway protein G